MGSPGPGIRSRICTRGGELEWSRICLIRRQRAGERVRPSGSPPLPVKDFPGPGALIRVPRATWKGTVPSFYLAGVGVFPEFQPVCSQEAPGVLSFLPARKAASFSPGPPTSHPLNQHGTWSALLCSLYVLRQLCLSVSEMLPINVPCFSPTPTWIKQAPLP